MAVGGEFGSGRARRWKLAAILSTMKPTDSGTQKASNHSPSLPGPQKPFDTLPLSGSLLTIPPALIPALMTYGAGLVVAASSASYFCLCVILGEGSIGLGSMRAGTAELLADGLVGVECVLPTIKVFGFGGIGVG